MGMPQKEAHENHILEMMEGKGTSHSCYRGVANLIHFTAGRANELWNVVCLAPPKFSLELIPTQVDNSDGGMRSVVFDQTVNPNPQPAPWFKVAASRIVSGAAFESWAKESFRDCNEDHLSQRWVER